MNIDTQLHQAVTQLQRGQLDIAEINLAKILQKRPKHPDVNHLSGIIAAQRGQYKKAVDLFNRAIKYAPQQAEFYNSLGLALQKSGHLKRALSAFKQAIQLAPHHVGAHYNLGDIQQDLGNLNAAQTAYEQVIQLKPQSAEAHNSYAVVLGRLGRMEAALSSCEQAIRITPGYVGAHYNRAKVLQALGRHEEALTAYKRTIQLKPDYAEAYSNMGNILFELEQTENARTAFEQTIKLNPVLPEVHNNLGNVLIKLGCFPEAAAALKAELQINPDSKSAKYLLATLGEKDTPQQSPEEYVSRVFNNCADKFDQRLVDTLGYNAPQKMRDAVNKAIDKPSQKMNILDLGCGTGLCGVAFAELANELVGVDLAEKMIKKADERGIYTDFIQADVLKALQQEERKFDLILSGDVFIYIGKLDEVFALTSKRMNPGGLFVFSIEINNGQEDYILRRSGRYAQSADYIEKLANVCGFKQVSYNLSVLRNEHGKPIDGSIIVLRLL